MKIYNLLFLATGLLLAAGCTKQSTIVNIDLPQADVKKEVSQPLLGGDRDAHGCIPSAGYSWCEASQKCYRPWEEGCGESAPDTALVPTPEIKQFIYDFSDTGVADCYYLENAMYLGNDLLVKLEEGNVGQAAKAPIFYVPENAKKLKLVIAAGLANQELKMRHVFACHLAEGLDVVSGVVWQIHRSWVIPNYKTDNQAFRDYNNDIEKAYGLLIVNGNKVSLVKDVPMRDVTVTGGDVSSCRARLVGENITWKCMTDVMRDDINGLLGGEYTTWTISRDGKILDKELTEEDWD